MAQWVRNLTSIMRMWVQSLALLRGLRIWRCCGCGIGLRHSLDPMWLWLWCRLASAAPTPPLAWEIHMLQVQPEKAKQKQNKIKKTFQTFSCPLRPLFSQSPPPRPGSWQYLSCFLPFLEFLYIQIILCIVFCVSSFHLAWYI